MTDDDSAFSEMGPRPGKLMMFCTQCGTRNSSDARFCCSCGNPLLLAEGRVERSNCVDNVSAGDDPSAALIDCMQRLAASGQLVSHRDMPPMRGHVNAAAVNSILKLSEDQYCRWHIQWCWSPAISPDAVAEEEQATWLRIYRAALAILSTISPEMPDLLRQQFNNHMAHVALTAKAEHDAKEPLRTTKDVALGFVGRRLNSIGLRGLAERTINGALFPPDSVGRNQE